MNGNDPVLYPDLITKKMIYQCNDEPRPLMLMLLIVFANLLIAAQDTRDELIRRVSLFSTSFCLWVSGDLASGPSIVESREKSRNQDLDSLSYRES